MRRTFRNLPNPTSALAALALLACAGVWARLGPGIATADPPKTSATASAVSDPPPTSGDDWLAQSAARMQRYTSLSASLRQWVDLFDQQLVGSGHFHQGPPGAWQLRLELKFQVGGQWASQLQVADGNTLWSYRQLIDPPQVQQVDLRRVRAALPHRGPEETPLLPEAITLGGLPKLLQSLREVFEWSAPEPAMLSNLPVYQLRGQWREDVLRARLQKGGMNLKGNARIDRSRLHQPLPDEILIYLGREDLFPYRLEYRKRSVAEGQESPTMQPIVVLEMFDVKVNEPLDPNLFRYSPGNLEILDRTARFLATHGLSEPPAE